MAAIVKKARGPCRGLFMAPPKLTRCRGLPERESSPIVKRMGEGLTVRVWQIHVLDRLSKLVARPSFVGSHYALVRVTPRPTP